MKTFSDRLTNVLAIELFGNATNVYIHALKRLKEHFIRVHERLETLDANVSKTLSKHFIFARDVVRVCTVLLAECFGDGIETTSIEIRYMKQHCDRFSRFPSSFHSLLSRAY